MEENLVTVENVSKKFCKNRYLSMKYGTLDIAKNLFCQKMPFPVLRKEEFFALQNISFKVKRGECLGFLGPNGAGKTTLLKLILGILSPDQGKIRTNGKISAILSRNAGFHMDLTGKENIFFFCSLYKKSKFQIKKEFDSIVEIAGLKEFINVPLKKYSSGMIARLIFALTVNLKADVLLFDDTLYVGDEKFVEKSEYILSKMKNNVAMIVVSHKFDTLIAQSNKVALLDKGKIKFLGNRDEAINHYYTMRDENSSPVISTGSDLIDIYDVSLKSTVSDNLNMCNYGDAVNVFFRIKSKLVIKKYLIIFCIITEKNVPIIRSDAKSRFGILKSNIEKKIKISVDKVQLIAGKYSVSIKFYDLQKNELLKTIKNAISFTVLNGPTGTSPLNMEYDWASI